MSAWRIIFISFLVFTGLLMLSCANQVSPVGGEKDTTPPEIIKEDPPNNSTQFKSNTIRLTTNEFIQLVNPFENVVSSPPFKNKPKVELKKHKIVEVTIDDELLDNTTYIVQFIGAIKDITEGNKLGLYQYIFSTGENIDSLKIRGEIIDVYTKAPVQDAWALLFPLDSEDSAFYKQLPVYIGKTGKDGRFSIDYIKEGKYQLFALKDENGNLKFDMPTEKIAFPDSLIYIDDTTGYYQLAVFQEEDTSKKKPSIVSTDPLGKMVLGLGSSNDSLTVELPADYQILYKEFNERNDTLTLWLNKPFTDSVLLIKRNQKVDTLFQRPIEIPDSSELKQKYKPDFSTNILQYRHIPKTPVILTFDQPLSHLDSNKIVLIEDSTEVHPQFYLDNKARQLKVNYKWKKDKDYKLILDEGAVTSVYTYKNDSSGLDFRLVNPESVASLEIALKIQDTGKQYIVQLIDLGKKKIVQENIADKSQTITYKYLNPGKYEIKAITDENRNNKWDTGSYAEKRRPEEIFYYPEVLELKANWEMEAEIILN